MTLRVTHTFGLRAGTSASFTKDVVRFGRAPECDVPFDPVHDRDASGHHAEIRREGATFVLVDQGSKNGTFVNGARIERHTLRPGDEIGFGTKGPRVRVDFASAAPGASRTVADESPRTERDPVLSGAPAAPPQAPSQAQIYAPAPAQHAPPPQAPLHAPAPAQHAPPPQAPSYAAPPHAPSYAAPPQAPSHAAPPQAPSYAATAPSPAPRAGARVGQKTMAVMIQSAVAAATGRSRPQKTQEIAAIVHREVHVATRGQRRAMGWLAAIMVLLLGGAGALFLWGRQSEDEVSQLRTDLASLPPGDPRRKEIEGRLGTLHPPNASFGRDLYDRSRKGIFMLTAGGQGFCTAFAVRPSQLATNAHCVAAAKRIGGPVMALENEGQGKVSYLVSDMRTHPSYRESDAENLTPDVAVVTITGKAAIVLELAQTAELSTMGVGDAVYVIGFPGRLTDTANPAATFLDGHIGRLTNAAGRQGGFAETWLVQHDASTTRGTSGSPVFNAAGRVVAVNAGGYREEDDQTIAGKKTEVVKESPYKLAMRVDLLGALVK